MSRVALIQMVSLASVRENLNAVEQLLKQAVDCGAQLVILPENFAFMGLYEEDKLTIAESYGDGPIQTWLRHQADFFNLWIIAGTISLKTKYSKVTASSLVYDDQGKMVARYDKIHLFDVSVSAKEHYHESATIKAGRDLTLIDTPVGKIGLTVCYDLRFPELYQKLTAQGAQLFAVPSAFTAVTGAAHWDVLLRARAIENLAYVLAANQGGEHQNMRVTYGHSMIVDPWGQILTQNEKGSGIIYADIDLNRLNTIRTRFPCLDHHVLI